MVHDESRAGGAGGGTRPTVGSVAVVSTVVLSPPAHDGQYIVAGTFGLPVVLLITACGSMQKRDCRHKHSVRKDTIKPYTPHATRGLLVALTASICA